MKPSFSELLQIHRHLDVLFAEHQYALLHFDFDRALELLVEYRSMLEEHMDYEEEHLIPLYNARASVERGGEAKLFLDEHEKMKNFMPLFIETIEALKQAKPPEPLLLKLLDRESFYIKLCSHHDTREAKVLYPMLDDVTQAEERTALVEVGLAAARC